MKVVWCSLFVLWGLSLGTVEAKESPADGFDGKSFETALSDYVAAPDESFDWRKKREGKLGTTEYAELILTSQTWRGIVWKHQLFILKPQSLEPGGKQALLMIGGGRWRDRYETDPGDDLPKEALIFATVAEKLKSPIAVLLQVPQQPIFGDRYEDAIIAYTFKEFLESGDPNWPLLLPMTKAAVRGMDAVEAWCSEAWSCNIEGFTVTGASKRGWTTYLTGALDPRATAIAPMVFDVLRMDEQMDHQKECWGEVSEQIGDYSQLNLHEQFDTPGGKALRQIVDPWSYRDRLVQPKWVILGTNDAYWPVDAANLYWEGLTGPKWLLNIPNNVHGLRDFARVLGAVCALHMHASTGEPIAEIGWDFRGEPSRVELEVHSDRTPSAVRAWTATAEGRDFREVVWTSRDCTPRDGAYFASIDVPATGYAALFGEAEFEGTAGPYFVSTTIKVLGGEDDSE